MWACHQRQRMRLQAAEGRARIGWPTTALI
jgi:hypothetical protein